MPNIDNVLDMHVPVKVAANFSFRIKLSMLSWWSLVLSNGNPLTKWLLCSLEQSNIDVFIVTEHKQCLPTLEQGCF